MKGQLSLPIGSRRSWRRSLTIPQLARRSGDRITARAQHLHRNPNTTTRRTNDQ